MSTCGTWARYNAGCRCDDCRTAARNYQKRRVIDAESGRPRRVSSRGVTRRIHALACLGWDMYAIAREVQTGRETVRQWTLHDTVYRTTHDRMAEVYDRLSMRLPPERDRMERLVASRARNKAKRNGWAPPLAWDDIDHDDHPRGHTTPDRDDVDDALVLRVLDGDAALARKATAAERAEIVRRWRGDGRALNELERLTGWEPRRYIDKETA